MKNKNHYLGCITKWVSQPNHQILEQLDSRRQWKNKHIRIEITNLKEISKNKFRKLKIREGKKNLTIFPWMLLNIELWTQPRLSVLKEKCLSTWTTSSTITTVGLKTKKLTSKFLLSKGTEHAILLFVCILTLPFEFQTLHLFTTILLVLSLSLYVKLSHQIQEANHKTRIAYSKLPWPWILRLLSRMVPNVDFGCGEIQLVVSFCLVFCRVL